jgi:hypothetical protein
MRGRLSYTVASRQVGGLVHPFLTLRIIALAVVLTVLAQLEQPVALVWCLPAVAVGMLRGRALPGQPAASAAQQRGSLPTPSTRGRRRRWIVVSWWDTLSALAVVAAASWGTVQLPLSSRLLALTAAATLLAVVCARLCLDPRWYRPDPRPRRLSRLLRNLAGPLGMVACQAVALPAPWNPGERTIVALLTLIPLANVALSRDQDLTLKCAVELIRSEAQDGRQAVLDELHGALSANLRLLEQASQELRATAPRLYELAVGANSQLRETLTLADPRVDSTDQPQTLAALVRTLAMAVGARGDLTVRLDRLSDGDRELARLVLNDLVRAVLAGGAGRVSATVELDQGSLLVVVTGDSAADPSLPARLAPLRQRMIAVNGTISGDAPQRLVARWPAGAGTA